MNKKNYTYSIHPEVAHDLDKKANELKRSKSSIVQEAIQEWLNRGTRNRLGCPVCSTDLGIMDDGSFRCDNCYRQWEFKGQSKEE